MKKDRYEIRRAALKLLIDQMIPSRFKRQTEMAEVLGFSPAHFAQMKSGNRSIGNESADRIEKGLGLPNGFLDNEDGNVEPGPDIRGTVPVISQVQAGNFAEVIDNLHPGDGERVHAPVPINRHTFGLRVSGDSMEPDFPEGLVLIVEPDLDPVPGDYVIAKNGDAATFKQLIRDGSDWYLKPINPRYPIKPLGDSHVIGVVRAAVRKLR